MRSGTGLTGPLSGKPDIGDAAPARGKWTYLPLPGGAGAPPGGTKTPCQELADGFARSGRKRGPAAVNDAAMAFSPDVIGAGA